MSIFHYSHTGPREWTVYCAEVACMRVHSESEADRLLTALNLAYGYALDGVRTGRVILN